MTSAAGWLMLGAIREDDVPFDAGELENTPQDEPDGVFVRVLNHFFDPYHDRPLTGFGGSTPGDRAPDWAILSDDHTIVGADGAPTEVRGNHYSLAAAREAMWRALTLKQAPAIPGAPGALPDLPPIANAQLGTGERVRRGYWATTFRSLGDAVHLLQDMAQPQHTRNDAHAGLGCTLGTCLLGHKSHYEAFVEAKVTKAGGFTLRERFFTWSDPNDIKAEVAVTGAQFGNLALPRFASYRDYFATMVGAQSIVGRGLANYSNQGFYTTGTNVDSAEAAQYLSPPPRADALERYAMSAGSVENAFGDIVKGGGLVLYRATVRDALDPERNAPSVPLAARGAFDEFLAKTTFVQTTLNHYNYDAQMGLLLPRAVAYSAGLLDYFFRGRMQIGLPEEGVYAVVDHATAGCASGCGFDKVKLRLTNATPQEDMGAGLLVAVAKFRRNTCYAPTLAGEPGGAAFAGYSCRSRDEEIVASDSTRFDGLRAGENGIYTFRFTRPIPVNATDLSLQVVFRGPLGRESDAVVVETRDIAEPTFIGFANLTDYVFDSARNVYVPLGQGTLYTTPDEIRLMKIHAGDVENSVLATRDRLAAGQHAQLAILADPGPVPLHYEWVSATSTAYSPMTWTQPMTQFYAPSPSSYASTIPVRLRRGVYREAYVFHTYPPDSVRRSCTTNPEFCEQSTMTKPLAAKDAVAWTITF